ncbi:MAG: NAD-dependent deacylase [Phycisphaeraceae bacterium]|nr:MAG: NAD-dependent deacylase [Phycisphaeraceae bacterium]
MIPDRLIATLRDARSVVALTGAGVSAESGVPTFRDRMEGHWAKFDPMQLATPEAFAADPEMVTQWYDWRRRKCLDCAPNPGHIALAELEELLNARGGRFTLLTQNVDRLHHRAGSRNVVELHGSIHTWRCTESGREVEPGPEPFTEHPMKSEWGGLLRPGVVWFGEALPPAALDAAFEAMESCDFFLSIGTSAVVHPAAGLIQLARACDAKTVEINRDPTPITSMVDWSISGLSGEILPVLLKKMGP